MENKRPSAIILYIAGVVLSVVTTIICFILNFEFNMDGSVAATTKNVIVTLSYIAIWLFILIIGIIGKNRGTMKYCLVFWAVTLLASILIAYLNATGTENSWVLTIGFLLIYNQWHGIEFFVKNLLAQSIIIGVISLVMFTIAVISLKRTKSA